MYIIKFISVLMPMIEMIASERFYPIPIKPGQSRITLSKNMMKKKRESKADLEKYLQDNAFRKFNEPETKADLEHYFRENALFRRHNREAIDKPKRSNDDFSQYLYEKYNNFRKSLDHRPVNNDVKYLDDHRDNPLFRRHNRKAIDEPKKSNDDFSQYLYEKYNNFRKSLDYRPVEDEVNYLNDRRDNPLFRRHNRKAIDKPKKSNDDFSQYLYEKYNNFRKSLDHRPVDNDVQYLYDHRQNPLFRRHNRKAIENPKKSNDDFSQYLYEKYYNFRKSLDHKPVEEEVKYLYDHSPYRKSLRQFRSLPILVIPLNDVHRSDSTEIFDDRDVLRSREDGVRQGKAIAVKPKPKKSKYDTTVESSSHEFKHREERQFKKWRQFFVCQSHELPKYLHPPNAQSLHPLKYKGTNMVLNEYLNEKRWRPSNPDPRVVRQTKPRREKILIEPLRRKTNDRYEKNLVPPRTEFELGELVN